MLLLLMVGNLKMRRRGGIYWRDPDDKFH